jgi:hypothetical protein
MRRRIISAFTIAETNTPKTADHRLRSPTPDPPDPPRDLQALQALQEMATKPKLKMPRNGAQMAMQAKGGMLPGGVRVKY